MIYFEKVSKLYPDNSIALDNVTFSIEQGEFVSIVGHSGAGKTTLLKLLLGEEAPSSGSVSYESVVVDEIKRNKIPQFRRKIGTVFQDFRLLSGKTAYENISFAMEAAGKTDAEIKESVPEVLALVGLETKVWSFPHELSGGERQRLAIARAIINDPEVVIADEPTGNLDPLNTADVVQILKKINELGTTVILTTHNKGVIDSLGKRVITLERGKIIRDDKKGHYIL